jgi:hypothetical protein
LSTISPDSYAPINIDFIKPIEFGMRISFREISKSFAPYNTVKDGNITVHYGYYVEDLFKIRKATRD